MLVVITIIGLIMGLVGPRVLNYLSESKVKAAKIQIESLSAALDLYYLDNGRYPRRAKGSTRWCAGLGVGWNGPYLKTDASSGRPLGPSLCLQGAGRPCALRSCILRARRARKAATKLI